jgi:hypothetical protein
MMLKCGHVCFNECFECQNYSTSQAEKGKKDAITIPNVPPKRPIRPIERKKHGECRYTCNKPLRCGHVCKNYCHGIKYYRCPPCNICVNNVRYYMK